METSPVVKLQWGAATTLLANTQRIIIVTHVRPDGDAIGSLCALGLALREHGKEVLLVVDGGVNEYLSYVPGSETVLPGLKNPRADLVIAVDGSDLDRLGIAGRLAFDLPCPKIVIDHHATNTFFGTAHIVHQDYVSTTEAVYRWLEYLGWKPSPPIATALLIGYMTDTIAFRVGPVTSATMGQVGKLMEYGANLRAIIERMLIRMEPGQVQLMGRGMARAIIEDHVIWTYLLINELDEFHLTTGEKPELSSEILRDANAYISCFFLETEEGDIRLSFRAVPGFDVGSIAASLGGGGHTLAAGATLKNIDLDTAMNEVIPLLKMEAQRGEALYK